MVFEAPDGGTEGIFGVSEVVGVDDNTHSKPDTHKRRGLPRRRVRYRIYSARFCASASTVFGAPQRTVLPKKYQWYYCRCRHAAFDDLPSPFRYRKETREEFLSLINQKTGNGI